MIFHTPFESAKGSRNCVIRIIGVKRAKNHQKEFTKSWCKSQLFFVYNLQIIMSRRFQWNMGKLICVMNLA